MKSKSERNKRKQRENPSAKLRKAFIQSGNVDAFLCKYKTGSKASLSIDKVIVYGTITSFKGRAATTESEQ